MSVVSGLALYQLPGEWKLHNSSRITRAMRCLAELSIGRHKGSIFATLSIQLVLLAAAPVLMARS